MFTAILLWLLRKYLSDWLVLTDASLSVNIFSGTISITNVKLKKGAVSRRTFPNLPVAVSQGQVAELKIVIPYYNLYDRPIQIELSGVKVQCHGIKKDAWREVLKRRATTGWRVDTASRNVSDDIDDGHIDASEAGGSNASSTPISAPATSSDSASGGVYGRFTRFLFSVVHKSASRSFPSKILM